jgi:DNA-binding MarR family transcriptional regulator
MGLGQEIKQQQFRNDYQKAMINLIYTHNWVAERFKIYLDNHELTPQQFNILRILRGAGEPISTLQIRERMLDKMSDTSRIVDRLVVKGLVKKTICSRDKRLVDVMIAKKGLDLLRKLDEVSGEMDDIMGNLNQNEIQELNALLDKVRERQLHEQVA